MSGKKNCVEVYDLRLGANPPKQNSSVLVLTTMQKIPVLATFTTIRAWSVSRPVDILRPFAHGAPGEVQIGTEELSDMNLHLFGHLAGGFAKDALIAVYSCSTGEHLKVTIGRGADPLLASLPNFMKNFARMTGVHVLGSKELQYYHKEPTITFGRWEGTLYVTSPAGDVVRVPNLGHWNDGVVEEFQKAKLPMRVIQQLHDEVVKRHPDYTPPVQDTGEPPGWAREI